ncbi:hypothetical protein E1301_Tti000179 [Triplophysa tibetana]|uniref:Uncharacterized protein n=1 Tax=Triplophysa tibetana TaxID=1572043 RepID=A0A5A9N3D6_9TELE|nr:hypothetical protein E1301_Tti000179 [Triplophysa tibetana]
MTPNATPFPPSKDEQQKQTWIKSPTLKFNQKPRDWSFTLVTPVHNSRAPMNLTSCSQTTAASGAAERYRGDENPPLAGTQSHRESESGSRRQPRYTGREPPGTGVRTRGGGGVRESVKGREYRPRQTDRQTCAHVHTEAADGSEFSGSAS